MSDWPASSAMRRAASSGSRFAAASRRRQRTIRSTTSSTTSTTLDRGNHLKQSIHRLGLTACLLVSGALPAWASQEIPVGRVDLQLPGDGWQAYTVEDKGNTISGFGYSHQQASEYKVLVRRGADQRVDAVVLVRASASGIGRFSGLGFTSAQCQGSSLVYAEGDPRGASARSFRCLRILGPQRGIEVSDFPEEARDVLAKQGWSLPPSMFVVSALQYATTGSFAAVVAYLRPLATGAANQVPERPPEGLPAGVTATSLEWGRRLQEAVSDSVYSIRGKLPVPDLSFADMASEPQPLPADTKPPAAPARAPAAAQTERG